MLPLLLLAITACSPAKFDQLVAERVAHDQAAAAYVAANPTMHLTSLTTAGGAG